MPYFTPDDLDIDPDEFISSCSDKEIKKLLEILKEDGYLLNEKIDKNYLHYSEEEYEKALQKLSGNWNRLSNEETDLIINLSKKL